MVGKKKLALILSGLLVMTGLMSCSSNNSSEKVKMQLKQVKVLMKMVKHILLE